MCGRLKQNLRKLLHSTQPKLPVLRTRVSLLVDKVRTSKSVYNPFFHNSPLTVLPEHPNLHPRDISLDVSDQVRKHSKLWELLLWLLDLLTTLQNPKLLDRDKDMNQYVLKLHLEALWLSLLRLNALLLSLPKPQQDLLVHPNNSDQIQKN